MIDPGDGATAARSTDRKSRVQGADRRDQVLEVAAALARAEGLGAVSMDRVAAAAEVSRGLIYFHFQNRAALLEALLEREVDVIDSMFREAFAGAWSLEDRVRAALNAYLTFLAERGDLLGALVVLSRADRAISRPLVEYGRSTREFWRRGLEKLGLEPTGALAAATLLSALPEIAARHQRTTEASIPDVVATFTTMALGAIESMAGQSSATGR